MAVLDKCSITCFSHIGNREENQDRFCVLQHPQGKAILCLVADGMGGHRGGALAAQTIVETVEAQWQEHISADSLDNDAVEAFLNQLITESHQAVKMAGLAEEIEPRSTVVALYLFHDKGSMHAISIHAGDSRAVQYSSSGKITRTIDHSMAQLKVLQGKISEEEMATDPDQGTVISNIGGEDEPESEITHWNLQQGNCFTICSDGFWEIFTDEEVLELFSQLPEDREIQLEKIFIEKIKQLPKHDNTTVIMLEIPDSKPDNKKGPSMSDTDKPDSSTPDVEDPVTNPGKTAPAPESAPLGQDDVAVGTGNNNKKLIIGIGVVIIVIALLFVTRGGQESDGENAGENSDAGQVAQEQVPAPAQEGTEGAGEGEANTEGGDAPAQPDEVVAGNDEGAAGQDRVLDSLELDTDISVSSDEELVAEVTDLLVLTGSLGPDDALTISSEAEAGGNRIIRMQQRHQGIPVFGGEVIAVENNGNVFNVSGSTGADIEIDVEPALTYEQALEIAGAALNQALGSRNEDAAQLLILEVEDNYHLAWYSVLLIDGREERVFLDANDGSVLLRLPTVIGEA